MSSASLLRSTIPTILGDLYVQSPSLCKDKGEVFSATGLAGPWGSGRLRLPDFFDFRPYEGGKFVTLHPQEAPGTHF
jgi:hypothetical protein